MPTVTIYADRVAKIDSRVPDANYKVDGFSVPIEYRKTSWTCAVYGFSVPESLYGKQIISGNITVQKETGRPPASVGYSYEKLMTPNELDVSQVTYDNLNVRAWFDNFGNEYELVQQLTDSCPANIAACLNGVAIYIKGTSGSNKILGKPYITVTYRDDVQVKILSNERSAHEYCDPHKEMTTTVGIIADIIFPYKITSGKVLWRIRGDTQYHENSIFKTAISQLWNNTEGVTHYYKIFIPAETFPSNKIIEYQVKIQIDGKWWSEYSKTVAVSTIDAISTAMALRPIGENIDVESDNDFSWKHIISSGSEPTGFELEYTTDNVMWTNIITKTATSDTQYMVNAYTIPAGRLWWRVRTHNGNGIAGAWSEAAAIIGYGAPPTPTISEITNSGRPTVRWQSATQIAYEIEINQSGKKVYVVGETASTDKVEKVKDFLGDGVYTLRLRIKNSGLYWSAWAESTFTINTVKPEAATIAGKQIKNGVLISTNIETQDSLYLLRDEKPIAKIYGTQVEDYTSVGEHVYKIRRVNSDGNFSDSKAMTMATRVEQAVFAPASAPEQIIGPIMQSQTNQYPSTVSTNISFRNYAGRKYPVAAMEETMSEEFVPQFASATTAHYLALRKLAEEGEVVVYRNSAGDQAHCVITDLSPTKLAGGWISWQMTMQRVDCTEKIDYDEVK